MGNVRTGQVIQLDYRKAAVMLMSGFIALLFFKNSEAASRFVSRGIEVSVTRLIPSLFPFLVVSSLLLSSGLGRVIGKTAGKPLCALLGISGEGACAVLLGFICGFPVGAKTACQLYERGSITKRECERLIAIANNTGPSFVIEVVGAHFWGCRGMGLTIYLAQILSSVLLGWITSRKETKPTDPPTIHTSRCDLLQCLTASVTHSARSVVSVCGFIVFFAVVTSLIGQMTATLPIPLAAPILGAVLEFSTGAAAASDLGGIYGAFLTGFTVSWSGISVFAQCKAFTAPHGISLRFTAACKAVQGLLTGLAAAVYYAVWFTPAATASTAIPQTDIPPAVILAEIIILTAASIQIPRRNT
jgi:sporulation integral membrane protein YlbJ